MALISDRRNCPSEENSREIHRGHASPITEGVTVVGGAKVNLAARIMRGDVPVSAIVDFTYEKHPHEDYCCVPGGSLG